MSAAPLPVSVTGWVGLLRRIPVNPAACRQNWLHSCSALLRLIALTKIVLLTHPPAGINCWTCISVLSQRVSNCGVASLSPPIQHRSCLLASLGSPNFWAVWRLMVPSLSGEMLYSLLVHNEISFKEMAQALCILGPIFLLSVKLPNGTYQHRHGELQLTKDQQEATQLPNQTHPRRSRGCTTNLPTEYTAVQQDPPTEILQLHNRPTHEVHGCTARPTLGDCDCQLTPLMRPNTAEPELR